MVNKRNMIPVEQLLASNREYKSELVGLASEAAQFLRGHRWCKSIASSYLDRECEGLIAVFYFEIENTASSADNRLWVIVGDLPPAYMDTIHCPNGATALEAYVGALQEWVDHVVAQESTEDSIPVYRRGSHTRVEPTTEYADLLASRLDLYSPKSSRGMETS